MKGSNIGPFASVSAVVKVIDGFTGDPVTETLSFELDGIPCAPLQKDGGVFVFMDHIDASLPHVVKITCKRFLDAHGPVVPLSSPLPDAVQVFALQPGPGYRYPNSKTVVAGRVVNATQQGIGDVVIAVLHNGRRGATRSDPNGAYTLALDLTADSVKTNLQFIKAGYSQVDLNNVQVTKGVATGVKDIIMQ